MHPTIEHLTTHLLLHLDGSTIHFEGVLTMIDATITTDIDRGEQVAVVHFKPSTPAVTTQQCPVCDHVEI